MIFDSTIHNWNIYTSEFDKIIYGKEKLIFLMEDTNDNIFGGFINSKIDEYRYKENNQWKGKFIEDPNSFIFSMKNKGKSNEMIKMDIKKEENSKAFTLYKKNFFVLFAIGGGIDICIMKENYKNESSCMPQSFKYPMGKENMLTGENKFSVKRIIVIQME